MLCGNDIDLSGLDGAIRAMKRPIEVAVVFAAVAGVCPTREGDIAYKAGDAILTGIEGEKWPIARDRFDETYDPIPPTEKGESGSYAKKQIVVYALEMQEAFFVDVSWGAGRLEGKPGDWLLQYGPDDFGIVSKSIFKKTYEIIK